MSTVLDREFIYAECADGSYNSEGEWVPGAVSYRTVRGTVQPMTGKECLAYSGGSRNSGLVSVFSSEILKSRTQGGNEGGYVRLGACVYQLENEQILQLLDEDVDHIEYTGCLVPEKDIPDGIKDALGL